MAQLFADKENVIMDYRELLKKYMKIVALEEMTFFLGNRDMGNMRRYEELSEAEFSALHDISEELTAEGVET